MSSIEVAYAKGLGEDASLIEVEEMLSHPKVRVIGLVIDKVDKIMHGMELGTAGMHNQVRQWAIAGFIVKTQFPDAIEWSPLGLPKEYLPLLAT